MRSNHYDHPWLTLDDLQLPLKAGLWRQDAQSRVLKVADPLNVLVADKQRATEGYFSKHMHGDFFYNRDGQSL